MSSDRGANFYLALFVVFVFLLGGGSRYDIVSLPFLRFAAVCAIGLGLYYSNRGSIARYRIVLVPLAAFTVWIALQLVPLPFPVWSALPGRDLLVQAGALIGLDDPWRPISVAPWRTMNALLAMSVPWGAFCLFAHARSVDTTALARVVTGLGLLSAILGIIQSIGPEGSPLYLYRITNEGGAVGLFSNRNHNAAFLACCFPLLGLVTARSLGHADRGRRARRFLATRTSKLVIGGAAAIVILLGIFATGSRGGFLAAGLGAACGLAVLAKSMAAVEPAKPAYARYFWAIGALAVIVALFLYFSEIEAVERLRELDEADELRLLIWGPISTLITFFGWTGAGFGTLPDVYPMVAPAELLSPLLVNHAHNDWLELAVEGGIPAMLIVALAVIMFLRLLWRVWRGGNRPGVDGASVFAFASVTFILAIFSVSDYPLRTPSLAALFLLAAMSIVAGSCETKVVAGSQNEGDNDRKGKGF